MSLFIIVLFAKVLAFDICFLFFSTSNCLEAVGNTKHEVFCNFCRRRAYCCMRMCLYRKYAHENATLKEKNKILTIFQVRAGTEQLVKLKK